MTYSTYYSIAFVCVLIATVAFELSGAGSFHMGWMCGAVGMYLLHKVVVARSHEAKAKAVSNGVR